MAVLIEGNAASLVLEEVINLLSSLPPLCSACRGQGLSEHSHSSQLLYRQPLPLPWPTKHYR